jgi:N6-L-threonylcarbamoyladenine synthase
MGGEGGTEMILAIESSCDESALAVWDPEKGEATEWLLSQIDLHSQYGGVVPELASREHLRALPLLLERFLNEVDIAKIQRLAVTRGPGLAPCLALGVAMAKALRSRWDLPLDGINHLRAHLFSVFMPLFLGRTETPREILQPMLPHLGLLVSGGNTMLACCEDGCEWTILAQTEDDAAGEALDKGAKLLGLPYPGGPHVEKLAKEGDVEAFAFPDGNDPRMRGRFSFSGLKTSLRYRLEAMSPAEVIQQRASLCASYQKAVFRQLVLRCGEELRTGKYRSFGLSGGVANNQTLRKELQALADRQQVRFLAAQPRHTGDNASMIAFTAWLDHNAGLSPVEVKLAPSLAADQR